MPSTFHEPTANDVNNRQNFPELEEGRAITWNNNINGELLCYICVGRKKLTNGSSKTSI